MTPQRKFTKDGYLHLYQISADKSLIFLTVPDMVLLFTLICVKARQYHIHVTALCIMYNHFHLQASAQRREDIEDFMKAVAWAFAFLYNKNYGLKGQLFHHPFGSAPKTKSKKISGNWIYIANNPVGKKAAQQAWDYRWNFLRYAPQLDPVSGAMTSARHPFSEEYQPLEASKAMLYLVKTVKKRAAAGDVIDYRFFSSSRYASLSEKERLQLLDIIITTYNIIDYEPIMRKYGSMEQFCRVLSEVEGGEYDLNDDWEPEDYRHYLQMISIAAEEGYDVRSRRLGPGGNYQGKENPSKVGSSSDSRHSASDKTLDCFGKCPKQKPLFDKNLSVLREMPEVLGDAERMIRRFKTEVGASDLEIGKFLRIKNYGKNNNGIR